LPSIKLSSGRTLLIEGPASVRLENGEGSILGAPLIRDWTTVREGRQIPVETRTEMGLVVRLGHGSSYTVVEESTIPTGWREASQVIQQSPGSVVILGDVDSGKSSLCTLLANECVDHGLKVAVIDGDVGQADIGPPTTISASKLDGYIFSLQDLTSYTSLFMGDTSPSSVSDKLLRGLVRLKRDTIQRSDVLLVNTDGWVQGDEALRYKAKLLEELQPDLVLSISSDGELDPLLELQRSASLRLARSRHARTRSREERKKAREYGYRRFLRNATRVRLRLGDARLRRFNSQQRQLRLNHDEGLRGVLAGLLDEEERLISIGRVERVANGLLSLTTALGERPAIVELGAVVLSPSFEEIGFEA
jgi:polynucleotide 5'-hydroxyl-kinase GRC3/NOL9